MKPRVWRGEDGVGKTSRGLEMEGFDQKKKGTTPK